MCGIVHVADYVTCELFPYSTQDEMSEVSWHISKSKISLRTGWQYMVLVSCWLRSVCHISF